MICCSSPQILHYEILLEVVRTCSILDIIYSCFLSFPAYPNISGVDFLSYLNKFLGKFLSVHNGS